MGDAIFLCPLGCRGISCGCPSGRARLGMRWPTTHAWVPTRAPLHQACHFVRPVGCRGIPCGCPSGRVRLAMRWPTAYAWVPTRGTPTPGQGRGSCLRRALYSGDIPRRLNSDAMESWTARASASARAASVSFGSGQSPGYLVSTAHSVSSARSGCSVRTGQPGGRRLRSASRSWLKGKSPFEHEGRLQGFLRCLLGEGADMAWRRRKGSQQVLGDIEVVSGEPQPAESLRCGRLRVAHTRPCPLGGRR